MAIKFKKLSAGGGGSATVTKQGGWVGTQVQNSGLVEKIYFNTSLTKEEVHNILSGLNFANAGAPNGMLIYMPFVDADYSCNIEIDYYPTTNEYTLSYAVDGVALRIFDSTNHDLENGWNTNYFIEAYNVNSENVANSFMAQFSVEMQNDKLTQLISSTPFTKEANETVTLSGDYDGATLKTELVNEWQGTQVQNSGLVEKVYINTSLTKEELYSLFDSLTFVEAEGDGKMYYMLASVTDTQEIFIAVQKTDSDYVFMVQGGNSNGSIYLGFDINMGGWFNLVNEEITNVDIPNVVEINGEVMPSMENNSIGAENDKITSLFSLTPFTPPNTIDIKALLEEKKLPLEINVSIPSNYFRMEKFTLPMVDIDRYGKKFPYLTTYYGTPLEKLANLMTGGQGYDTLYAHEYAYFRPNGKIYMNDGSGEYGFHCCLEVKSYYTRGMMFELTFDFGDLPVSEYGIKRFLMAYIEIDGENNEMFIGGLDFMGKDNYDDSYTQYTDDTIIETFKAFITKFEIWLPQV